MNIFQKKYYEIGALAASLVLAGFITFQLYQFTKDEYTYNVEKAGVRYEYLKKLADIDGGGLSKVETMLMHERLNRNSPYLNLDWKNIRPPFTQHKHQDCIENTIKQYERENTANMRR